MKTGWKPDNWQKQLLTRILDAYERTGTYRGESQRNQNIRIPV